MLRILGLIFALLAAPALTAGAPSAEQLFRQHARELYDACGLRGTMAYDVFAHALTGYYNLRAEGKVRPDAPLTVVDFRRPSSEKRLYVVDVANRKLLYHTWTSHGRGSGNLRASTFSDVPNSHQSSLGFYVGAETYHGKHGYSLRLDGQDRGFNHHARARAIVMHGADYVSEAFVKRAGRLGRSYGCPALAWDVYRPVIDLVKEGGCLFLFSDDATYLQKSRYLRPAGAAAYVASLPGAVAVAQ
ncbi:MAG: murein L,D-transpeptidase catalytic domain family protein [Catalinimonas sp.]